MNINAHIRYNSKSSLSEVHKLGRDVLNIKFKNPQCKGGGDGNTYYANTTNLFQNGETVTGDSDGSPSATTAGSNAAALGDFDNQYITISEDIIGIKGEIPFYRQTEASTNMFSVNYQYASKVLVDVMKNYKSYLERSRKMPHYMKENFNINLSLVRM